MKREGLTKGRCRQGFTLIELLVVISIIALLVSILVPALGDAKWQARVAKCQANMHNTGMAVSQYAVGYQMDRPWLSASGEQTGSHEGLKPMKFAHHPIPPTTSSEDKQPGNPAMAMCWEPFPDPDNGNKIVTFAKFLDSPETMFDPTGTATFDVNYLWWANAYEGNNSTHCWGSWAWIYPILNDADNPYNKLCGGYPTTKNAQSRAKDVMIFDWDYNYNHNNILYWGGTVEYLGARCGGDPSNDDTWTWFYGPTGVRS